MSDPKNNPYLNDDEDEDLIHPQRRRDGRHIFDGTLCPRCNVVHDASLPNDLPPEVVDQLSDLIDSVPEIAQSQILVQPHAPGRMSIIENFLGYIKDVNSLNGAGPMLRAIAEVLDSMTGGEITRRWEVYSCERELIVHHYLIKGLVKTIDAMKEKDVAGRRVKEDGENITDMMEKMLETAMKNFGEAADQYRKTAETNGIEVDEGLISGGDPEREYPPIAKHTMKDLFERDLRKLTGGGIG